MTKVVIESNVGGTGVLTVYAPSTSNTATINLPTSSGDLLTTGSTGLNANNITVGILAAANGGTGINSSGTAGNVLTSDGSAWVSQAAGGGFASGTVMLFAQTSAPTGWTKNTSTGNNSALRLVTGTASTGGNVDFATVFVSNRAVSVTSLTGSVGATTLTTPQIPSHSHPAAQPGAAAYSVNDNTGAANSSTGAAGGGGSHTHPLSVTGGSGTVDLDVKYVDIIRATKD